MEITDTKLTAPIDPSLPQKLFIGEKDGLHLCANFTTLHGKLFGLCSFASKEQLVLYMLKHSMQAHAQELTISEVKRIVRGKKGCNWLAIYDLDDRITLLKVEEL